MRRLSAIEIAEGALLADIGVIFNLLVRFLPFGGGIFRTLTFVVFALLVQRRGLYAGIMGGCVALFICAVVTGPLSIFSLSLQVAGGLFIGMAMKRHMNHLLTLLLSITGGAIALYGFFILISFFFAINIPDIMHQVYAVILGVVNVVATAVGLGNWWLHTLYPLVDTIVAWAFRYWWAFLFVVLWIGIIPVTLVIYTVVNALLRLLGYDVEPFPGGRIERWRRHIVRRLVKIQVKRRMSGRSAAEV